MLSLIQGSHSYWQQNPGLFHNFPRPPWEIFQDLFRAHELLLNITKKEARGSKGRDRGWGSWGGGCFGGASSKPHRHQLGSLGERCKRSPKNWKIGATWDVKIHYRNVLMCNFQRYFSRTFQTLNFNFQDFPRPVIFLDFTGSGILKTKNPGLSRRGNPVNVWSFITIDWEMTGKFDNNNVHSHWGPVSISVHQYSFPFTNSSNFHFPGVVVLDTGNLQILFDFYSSMADSASYLQRHRKWVVAYRLWGEGLVWLIGALVCSWVIWRTSVTVESEGWFLSCFVFFEG